MALNFPDASSQPTDGSFTTVRGGVKYAWYGYWTTAVGDIQAESINGGPLAGFRNQIINGAFNIWQRGVGPFDNTAAAAYTADRWMVAIGGNGMTRSDSHPDGFEYSISLPANGILQQGIELNRPGQNGRFALGSTWTLSLWATSAPRANAEFLFRDNVGSGLNEKIAGPSTAWVNTGETKDGFTRYTATVTLTGNAEASNTCLELQILAAATTSNITGVQLEPGPVATPFEHRPIGTELALCQRYYYQDDNGNGVYVQQYDSNNRMLMIWHPVEMRALPSADVVLEQGKTLAGAVAPSTRYWKGSVAAVPTDSETYRTNNFSMDAEL